MILITIPILMVIGIFLVQIPFINRALSWRLILAETYVRMALNPVDALPTPDLITQPAPAVATSHSEADDSALTAIPTTMAPPISPALNVAVTPSPALSPTPTMVPTPLPPVNLLPPPPFDIARDIEDWNNCGPATMALYLRYYGWVGDQYDIAKVIKPTREDANVNVDELAYYVRTQAGWLNAEFRVNGDTDTLRKFLSAGIPVMIEETFTTDRKYWPNDDLWAGHYLLLTGYDDRVQQFTVQDVELGPNQKIDYAALRDHWESFNHVYLLVFKPEQSGTVKLLLGDDWDATVNRQNALKASQMDTQDNPKSAFAWFNLGTNLVYFDRYTEAAPAYDTARSIGIPARMLRYQFGPFITYFHVGRIDDLMALTKYALSITRVSEEAMLWRAWGFYRQGDKSAGISQLNAALQIRPTYADALYALDYMNKN